MAGKPRERSASPAGLKALGDRLRSHREAAGLTQTALAEHLGISSITVSRAELGRQLFEFPTLIRFAELFGITLNDLVPMPESAALWNPPKPDVGGQDLHHKIRPAPARHHDDRWPNEPTSYTGSGLVAGLPTTVARRFIGTDAKTEGPFGFAVHQAR